MAQSDQQKTLLSIWKGTYRHPLVRSFTQTCLPYQLDHGFFKQADAYAGWGYKGSGKTAIRKAKASHSNFFIFEDGFVRSLFPGYQYGSVYSIIADTSGIYYDASGESDLIKFLNHDITAPTHWAETPSNVDLILKKFKDQGVSKYNHNLHQYPQLPEGILVVDQTKGDAAITHGGIEPEDFDRMLEDAIQENPDLPIYVKTHPDHRYRKKKSCFSETLLSHPSVQILPHEFSPKDCFSFCKKIYVGTSLMGMEALLYDCEVYAYGANFFAGWGLTHDRYSASPPRKQTLTLEQLFSAAYLRYSLYFHPDSRQPCSLDSIIDHIALQHRVWAKQPQNFDTFGLSLWKKFVLPKYTFPNPPKKQINNLKKLQQTADPKTSLLVWGKKEIPNHLVPKNLWRVEDGFIRSRGLGAQFNFPLSWVFDKQGIYFDATKPSSLETILQNHNFSESELNEARELITFLKEQKITKYNLGIHAAEIPLEAQGKRLILIPGQVDSDASITYGSPEFKTNKELLAEVRRQHPDAFICYKPHPDLLAGARSDAPLWNGIEQEVDLLIQRGDIISWIQAVDEVHTLTSTVGLEALLHQKTVFTYGLPFYAGWGLTRDWLACERRATQRNLEELVAAAYLLYPRYFNPQSGEFTTALNTAKMISNPNFSYDSRPLSLKLLGNLKTQLNKLRNR